MIGTLSQHLPLAAGTLGTLAIARYLWAAQKIASVARIGAVIVVLVGIGGATGVVDMARLVDLLTGLAGVSI